MGATQFEISEQNSSYCRGWEDMGMERQEQALHFYSS